MWAESEQSWGCSPMGSWAGSGEGLVGHGEDGPGRWPTRWAAVNASGTSGLLLLAEEEAEAMARLDGGGGTREAGGGARDDRDPRDLRNTKIGNKTAIWAGPPVNRLVPEVI